MVLSETTKQKIYNIASEYIKIGLIPTQKLIKQKLGKGSNTTIHKYLRQWFQEYVKTASCLHDIDSEVNRNLEQTLQKQITQNEHYADELINAEKTIIKLKEENYNLQSLNQKLQFQLDGIVASKTTLENLYHELKSQLDSNTNTTISKQQKAIDELHVEIKLINQTSIEALRQASQNGHELLMQAKVEQINLQAKIDSLTKELLETKKQLHEAITIAQVQNKSLLRQNEELQTIIQEHGLEQVPQLEERSKLNPTNAKVRATIYGK